MKVRVLLIPETMLEAASVIHMRMQSLDFPFFFLSSLYGFLSFARCSCFFLYSSSSFVISPVQSLNEKPCTFAWFSCIDSTLCSGYFVIFSSSKFVIIGWFGALIKFYAASSSSLRSSAFSDDDAISFFMFSIC